MTVFWFPSGSEVPGFDQFELVSCVKVVFGWRFRQTTMIEPTSENGECVLFGLGIHLALEVHGRFEEIRCYIKQHVLNAEYLAILSLDAQEPRFDAQIPIYH